ncbi:MAG: KH domain-containing protein [Patescibacteria group bacterium]
MSAQEFLRFIVESLVENKGDIVIEQREDELGTLITLKVNKTDMGTIIGREGQTISSIRTVLRVFGSKQNARVNLKVLED